MIKPKLRLYWSITTLSGRDRTTKGAHALERVTLDLGDGEREIPVTSLTANTEREFTYQEFRQTICLEGEWDYEDVIK
tara:strand:+ start:4140 stop:4373 length:234 start_codon:yes stop_codon:yes gene_type:complete